MNKGKFITIEGGEGSGKSTIIKEIKKYLDTQNIPCIITREPGGTETSEDIRKILKTRPVHPYTEIFLFEAARVELVSSLILPALEKNVWVICDRFSDSTIAYQSAGRKIKEDLISSFNEIACQGLKPDLTFLLNVSPEIGFSRIKNRNQDLNDPLEQENIEFYLKIQKKYLELAKNEPDRIKIINSNQEPHLVWNNIKKILKNEIN